MMQKSSPTNLYVTIDTEYSALIAKKHGLDDASRKLNFALSIDDPHQRKNVGLSYQMDWFAQTGIKAVFFVDPLPALIWGTQAIADIVQPILERGHDVQLHGHTEWLEFDPERRLAGGMTGRNFSDFPFDTQCEILEYARDTLIKAGAPSPIAFRAGNYGANDDTLRALASLGIEYDSSHCPGIANSDCAISLGSDTCDPLEHCGVIEVPVGCIEARGGALRHFQLTAISSEEIMAALKHSAEIGRQSMTLVSHSFELLSRDRSKPNLIVKKRFEELCHKLGKAKDVQTATYRDSPPQVQPERCADVMPFRPVRSGKRFVEQAIGNVLYGSK